MSTLKLLKKASPLTLSDAEIKDMVADFYGQTAKIDPRALFSVVSDIMGPSISATIATASTTKSQTLDKIRVAPPANFDPSTNELKRISCQMMSTPYDENYSNALETTLWIHKQLVSRSAAGKAVTTLAAFALEYGNFWHLLSVSENDTLGSSLRVLNHVYALDPNRKDLIADYNLLVKSIYDAVTICVTLEYYWNQGFDEKFVPFLPVAVKELPKHVFWIILAIVACASHIDILLGYSAAKYELSKIGIKISNVRSDLQSLLGLVEKEIDDYNKYFEKRKCFQNPIDIVHLIKCVIFSSEDAIVSHGLSGAMYTSEVFRQKHVVFFISGLENIEDEIRLLTYINNDLKRDPRIVKKFKKDDFKFLWVPIVPEQNRRNNNENVREMFQYLKKQMDWYVVDYNDIPEVCLRAITDTLGYNVQHKRPIAPVFNHQGRRVNDNALHMMFAWGVDGFPWRPEDVSHLGQRHNWFWAKIKEAYPTIQNWVNEEGYIFVYGATDSEYREEELLDRFTDEIQKVKVNETTKRADAIVNYYHYGRNDPKTIYDFWRHVENMFCTMRKDTSEEAVSAVKDITKFLCLRHERSGWVVVAKGPNIKLFCLADAAYRALTDFNKWKGSLLTEAGLDIAFGIQYRKILPDEKDCKHLKLKSCLTDASHSYISCPECDRHMEIEAITYACCHAKPTMINPDASVKVDILK